MKKDLISGAEYIQLIISIFRCRVHIFYVYTTIPSTLWVNTDLAIRTGLTRLAMNTPVSSVMPGHGFIRGLHKDSLF